MCQEKYTIRIQAKYQHHMKELEGLPYVRMIQIDNECLNTYLDGEKKEEDSLSVTNTKQLTIK